jgi:hypothetical protein
VAYPPQPIRVGENEYSAVRIDVQGWHGRMPVHRVVMATYHYQGTVWYSPDLMRVVRFSLEKLGSTGRRETLELVRTGGG